MCVLYMHIHDLARVRILHNYVYRVLLVDCQMQNVKRQ